MGFGYGLEVCSLRFGYTGGRDVRPEVGRCGFSGEMCGEFPSSLLVILVLTLKKRRCTVPADETWHPSDLQPRISQTRFVQHLLQVWLQHNLRGP